MSVLVERLAAEGINLRSYHPGNYKLLCPRCSSTRANRTDCCLSVTVDDDDGAVWRCHNCSYSGNVPGRTHREAARQVGPQRHHRPSSPPSPARPPAIGPLPKVALDWFAARGISAATLARNGIGWGRKWIPGLDREVDAIAFPYRRNGEVVNVKWRTLDKQFAQEKGAEKIFYGIDDITGDDAIIVEGECDKLAMEEAGYTNVMSVPDGAPQKIKDKPSESDAKFSYLANCEELLNRCKRLVLAVDSDEKGLVLAEELARRIGREKCWRVEWPNINDAPCKDANDVLRDHGADVLRECIKAARPFPIASLHCVNDYRDDVLKLYHVGRARAQSTGWRDLDEHLTIAPGQLSVVTGVPNSGKSEWVDALAINLAKQYGWRFAVCSFENSVDDHLSKLAEKFTGRPFWDGLTQRMTADELQRALDWAQDHFYMIRFEAEPPTIDNVLSAARGAVLRYGITGLVIDPYNELEHSRPPNQTETEYVSQLLSKVKQFARLNGVHVWFIAHPAKMYRDGSREVPVPTLYDISGSANWVNKADVGVVVSREWSKVPLETEIHVRKVRHKWIGKIGSARLRYDKATGIYSDLPPPPPARWAQGQ